MKAQTAVVALAVVVCSLLGDSAVAQQWEGPAAIAIRVTTDKGDPVENAQILLRVSDDDLDIGPAPSTTDVRGEVLISGLVEGEWYVEVTHPTYMLFAAYLDLRAGKKPIVGFSSQVNTQTSWTPMTVKFFKAAPTFNRGSSTRKKKDRRPPEVIRETPPTVSPKAPEVVRPEPPVPQVVRPEPQEAPTPEEAPEVEAEDRPIEQPVGENVEPMQAPVEEPADEPAPEAELEPTSAPEATEEPMQPSSAELPAEVPPVELPTQMPETAPVDEPAATPTELPVEQAVEKAVEMPAEAPETPVEKPVETSAEVAASGQAEVLAEVPVEVPAEAEVAGESVPPAPVAEPEVPSPQQETLDPTPRTVETPSAPIEKVVETAVEAATEPSIDVEEMTESAAAPLPTAPEPTAPVIPASGDEPSAAIAENEPTVTAEPAPPPVVEAAEEVADSDAMAVSADVEVETSESEAPEPEVPVAADERTASPPAAPSPEAASSAGSPTRSGRIPAYLRSAAAGTCRECQEGEWAVASEQPAARAGDPSNCTDEFFAMVQEGAELLADTPASRLSSYAGPALTAMWRIEPGPARSRLQELLPPVTDPESNCQMAGVVLPAGADYSGYVVEAWDSLGGRSCRAGMSCAVGQAIWVDQPTIVEGKERIVVYEVFKNRSTRRERRARLTIYFQPPSADWAPSGR